MLALSFRHLIMCSAHLIMCWVQLDITGLLYFPWPRGLFFPRNFTKQSFYLLFWYLAHSACALLILLLSYTYYDTAILELILLSSSCNRFVCCYSTSRTSNAVRRWHTNCLRQTHFTFTRSQVNSCCSFLTSNTAPLLIQLLNFIGASYLSIYVCVRHSVNAPVLQFTWWFQFCSTETEQAQREGDAETEEQREVRLERRSMSDVMSERLKNWERLGQREGAWAMWCRGWRITESG